MTRSRYATGAKNTSSTFPAVTMVLTGDKTLTQAEMNRSNQFFVDPGGSARNLDLPAFPGGFVIVWNTADGVEAITVRDQANTTVAVLDQNQHGVFGCSDAGVWQGLMGTET